MLYPFETFLIFLWEIDFRCHKELFAKDDSIFIRQLEGSLIRELIVRERLMSIFKEMTVLMLHFSHDILSIHSVTM